MAEFYITDSHGDRSKSKFCFFAHALKEKKKRQAHILAHLVALHTDDRSQPKELKFTSPPLRG